MSLLTAKSKLRGYYSVFRIRMLHSLQYRAAALAGLATQFFWGFMLIMIFEAFYKSGGVQEFTFSNLVSYIWLQQAFLMFYIVWLRDNELGNIIVNGNISYELVRPYSVYSFWFAKLMGNRLSGGLLRFPLVIIIALLIPAPYNLSTPVSLSAFGLFTLSLLLGVVLTTCIVMLMYISMFKTHSIMGSFVLFGITTDFFGGHYIPIPLMPDWLQKITVFMPFRYTSDLPFRIYSGHISGMDSLYGILIEFFWIAVLIILGRFLMQRVSKKVVVFGG